MSLILLNALLILVGPFLVIAPIAALAAVQSRPWRPARFRLHMPTIQIGVAW